MAYIELAILVVLLFILVTLRDICHYTRTIVLQLARPQQPTAPAQSLGARRRLRY